MRAHTICAVAGCPNLAESGDSRCIRHKRKAGTAWRKLSQTTVARAQGRCEMCGQPSTRLSAHHVRALVSGGAEVVEVDELVAACPSCQQRANAQTPRGLPARRS